jgi:hypothetical protein
MSSSSSDKQDEEGPVLFEFIVIIKGDPHAGPVLTFQGPGAKLEPRAL